MKKLLLSLLVSCVVFPAFAGGKSQSAKEQVTLTLAAAASLENVFKTELIPEWTKKHPNVAIEGSYASSGKLEVQIKEGLAADVFFSAAEREMDNLVKDGYIEQTDVIPLLYNTLALIKAHGVATAVTSFETVGLTPILAVGHPNTVPAGRYAKEHLTKLGLWDEKKFTLGTDVTEVLNWVASGSAPVGIVYATDAAQKKDTVDVITLLPATALTTPIVYPVATLKNAPHKAQAAEFIAFLQSDFAKEAFTRHGFVVK